MTTRPQTRTHIDHIVAVPHRLLAREAFLRAVLTHTNAIEDLHAQRTTLAIAPSTADHLKDLLGPRVNERRAEIVRGWAATSAIAAPWIESWGIAALARWEVGAACRDPHCPFACTAIDWTDHVAAFEVALFRLHDGWQAGESLGHDLVRAVEEMSPDAVIETPNPLIETQDAFVARARAAYIAAKHALTVLGLAAPPRELERHSAWLVRVRVRRQESVLALAAAEHVDASVVHKAIKQLAHLIDFPLR